MPIDFTIVRNLSKVKFCFIQKDEKFDEKDPLENMVIIIEKIDSKLSDMSSHLISYGDHLDNLRNLLRDK